MLQFDEYVVFYAPATAQMRTVRFGGQEHVFDEAPGSVGPAQMIPVRITCYDTLDEYLALSVRADTTVERLAAYLFKGEWREGDAPKEKEAKDKKEKARPVDDIRVNASSRMFAKHFARLAFTHSKCQLAGRSAQATFYSLAPGSRTLIEAFGVSTLAVANDGAPVQVRYSPIKLSNTALLTL